jgi:hypothetical protein
MGEEGREKREERREKRGVRDRRVIWASSISISFLYLLRTAWRASLNSWGETGPPRRARMMPVWSRTNVHGSLGRFHA